MRSDDKAGGEMCPICGRSLSGPKTMCFFPGDLSCHRVALARLRAELEAARKEIGRICRLFNYRPGLDD